MRILGYALLLTILFSVLWWGRQSWTAAPLVEGAPYELGGENRAQHSQLYLFEPEKPIEYVLSQSPDKLLLSTVGLLKEQTGKTLRHQYGVMFETLTADDKLLEARQFSFGSYIAQKVDVVNTQEKVPEYFSVDKRQYLATPQNIYVDISDEVKKVRVTLLFKSDRVNKVGLRLYQKVERNSRLEPIDVWARLSRVQKQKLTEYYPFELAELTDEERGHLARYRWQPVVPLGVEGTDYVLTSLFSVPKSAILEQETLLETQQNMSDMQRHVTFPIHEAGDYALSLQHIFGAREFDVFVTWHGMEVGQSQSYQFRFTHPKNTQPLYLEKGLLDITSSIPVAVELHSDTQEVVEHQHLVASYLVDDAQPLRFALLHADEKGTPLRINLQQYGDGDVSPHEQGQADIDLLDEKGEVVKRFTVMSSQVPAWYHQVYGAEFFNWLSEVESRYIHVPSHVKQVKVSSNVPQLVRVATRPNDLPSQRTFPQQKKGWFDYEGRIADWFAIAPLNLTQLVNEGRILMVKYYHQPYLPEELDAVWALASVLTHDPKYAVQTLMLPVAEHTLETEPAPARFHSLPITTNTPWQHPSVFPTLFFVKSDAEAMQIQGYIEQEEGEPKALPPFWIAGKWGEALLPMSLSPKDIAALRLPKSIQWFVNYASGSNKAMDKRRAVYLEAKSPLTLSVDKTQATQSLTFVVYPTSEQTIEILVEVIPEKPVSDQAGVFEQHSFLKRRVIIHPDTQPQGYQLYSDNRLKARSLFFITLGDDLPNQAITIKLSILNGDGAYINAVHKVAKNVELIKRFTLH